MHATQQMPCRTFTSGAVYLPQRAMLAREGIITAFFAAVACACYATLPACAWAGGWGLYDVINTVAVACLISTSQWAVVRVRVGQDYTFQPSDVPLGIALFLLPPDRLLAAQVLAVILLAVVWGRRSPESLLLSAHGVGEYAVAYAILHAGMAAGLPLAGAVFVSIMLTGVVTTALAVCVSSLRTKQWRNPLRWELHRITAGIGGVMSVIALPIGWMCLTAPVAILPATAMLVAVAMGSHAWYAGERRARAVDAFDSRTHDDYTTCTQVLDELARQLCAMCQMDRVHIIVTPASHNARASDGHGPGAGQRLCAQCDLVAMPIDYRYEIPTSNGFVVTVDVGRSNDRTGRVYGHEIAAMRQLCLRALARWVTARALADTREAARRDPATGLFNERALIEDLGRRTPGPIVAMLRCLDLDAVRLTLGWHEERRATAHAARAISDAAERFAVQAYRVGEDVFVLSGQTLRADIVRRIMRAASTHPSEEAVWTPRFAAGYAPTGDCPDHTELLRRAHVALYLAETTMPEEPIAYDHVQEAATLEHACLRDDLRAAIENDELCVAFQPQISVTTGRIMSTEALARWDHPERGAVSPSVFAPLAESSGLIVAMTRRIMHAAFAACSTWQREHPHVGVSINVSPACLMHRGLCDDIISAVQEYGLQPGTVTIELTESMVLATGGAGPARLQAFRDAGLRVSLDDFGTGYSSLATLRELPLDVVKIDRSFVLNAAASAQGMSLAERIVDMLGVLEVDTVVEGVETEDMARVFAHMGCDAIQGFVFARPVPLSDVIDVLADDDAAATQRLRALGGITHAAQHPATG